MNPDSLPSQMHRLTRAVLIVLFFSAVASAQTVNGAFHGVVTDQSGATVPAAVVEITNLGTRAARRAVTDSAGYYTIPQLPPGHYSASVTKTGFAKVNQPDIELLVNQDLDVSFALNPGAVSETVSVTAAPPPLETASATIAQVVSSQQAVDLPLNGRQFTELVLLTPGAAPVEGAQQQSFTVPIGGGGLSPAVSGQRPQQNNFTLDGILNNALFTNIWAISPPPDAIQEFNVQSHIVDTQFSISSGANINVVTKSGSNQLHGDAWEFLRNDDLDAANYFDNASGKGKPPFRMNQYGFTVGGPVWLPKYDGRKQHTYFFAYWEGFRSNQGFTLFNNVPTAQELSGNFSDLLTSKQGGTDALGRPIDGGQLFNPYSTRQVTTNQVDPTTGLVSQSTGLVRDPFPGNIIPASMISSKSLAYLKAFYPSPNYGAGANSFPNLAVASNQSISNDQFGIRGDHTFRNNDTLYGAFYYTDPVQTSPQSLLLGANNSVNTAAAVSVGYTHLFSPTFLLTLHYGYTHTKFGTESQPAGEALLAATNLEQILPVRNDYPLVPQITLAPRLGGTSQSATPFGPIDSHEFTADVQKIRGAHTISAGMMWYHVHSFDDGWSMSVAFDQYPTSAIYGNNANLSSTGDGLASMLLNLPSSINGQVGNTGADLTTNWQGYYLQDKWQVTKRLHLQFGLRYDYVAPPTWKDNQISGFDLSCGCFLIAQPFPPSFPTANVRKTYFDPQYNGFQPRFGFAYSATGKTVIRGAFAIFDDHDNSLIQLVQGPRIKWPWAAGIQQGGFNRGVPNLFFDNLPAASSLLPQPGQPGTPQVNFSADPRAKIPYAMEWNFGIQRVITSSLTASVDYVASGSRHLYITSISNTPLLSLMGPGPIAPKTPNPQFGQINYIQNLGTGSYNSLQVKVEKRFSAGLSFLASYTWSKCLDIASTGQSAGSVETIYDLRRNYGKCDYDVPQLFVVSYTYELPFGKGHALGANWNRVGNALLGGWRTAGIVSANNGIPFTVTVPFDNANVNGGQQRAQLVGNPLPSGFHQSITGWYNTAAFAVPAAYTFGNLGRNTVRGPGRAEVDLSLFKDFRITESKSLELRGDGFNLFNRVNFGQPNGSVGSPTFLQITSASAARQVQVAAKFIW